MMLLVESTTNLFTNKFVYLNLDVNLTFEFSEEEAPF